MTNVIGNVQKSNAPVGAPPLKRIPNPPATVIERPPTASVGSPTGVLPPAPVSGGAPLVPPTRPNFSAMSREPSQGGYVNVQDYAPRDTPLLRGGVDPMSPSAPEVVAPPGPLQQLGEAAAKLGNDAMFVIDTPGRAVRAVVNQSLYGDKGAIDDFLAGKDVTYNKRIEAYGKANNWNTWGILAAKLGANIISDPFVFVTGALSIAGNTAKAVGAANTAGKILRTGEKIGRLDPGALAIRGIGNAIDSSVLSSVNASTKARIATATGKATPTIGQSATKLTGEQYITAFDVFGDAISKNAFLRSATSLGGLLPSHTLPGLRTSVDHLRTLADNNANPALLAAMASFHKLDNAVQPAIAKLAQETRISVDELHRLSVNSAELHGYDRALWEATVAPKATGKTLDAVRADYKAKSDYIQNGLAALSPAQRKEFADNIVEPLRQTFDDFLTAANKGGLNVKEVDAIGYVARLTDPESVRAEIEFLKKLGKGPEFAAAPNTRVGLNNTARESYRFLYEAGQLQATVRGSGEASLKPLEDVLGQMMASGTSIPKLNEAVVKTLNDLDAPTLNALLDSGALARVPMSTRQTSEAMLTKLLGIEDVALSPKLQAEAQAVVREFLADPKTVVERYSRQVLASVRESSLVRNVGAEAQTRGFAVTTTIQRSRPGEYMDWQRLDADIVSRYGIKPETAELWFHPAAKDAYQEALDWSTDPSKISQLSAGIAYFKRSLERGQVTNIGTLVRNVVGNAVISAPYGGIAQYGNAGKLISEAMGGRILPEMKDAIAHGVLSDEMALLIARGKKAVFNRDGNETLAQNILPDPSAGLMPRGLATLSGWTNSITDAQSRLAVYLAQRTAGRGVTESAGVVHAAFGDIRFMTKKARENIAPYIPFVNWLYTNTSARVGEIFTNPVAPVTMIKLYHQMGLASGTDGIDKRFYTPYADAGTIALPDGSNVSIMGYLPGFSLLNWAEEGQRAFAGGDPAALVRAATADTVFSVPLYRKALEALTGRDISTGRPVYGPDATPKFFMGHNWSGPIEPYVRTLFEMIPVANSANRFAQGTGVFGLGPDQEGLNPTPGLIGETPLTTSYREQASIISGFLGGPAVQKGFFDQMWQGSVRDIQSVQRTANSLARKTAASGADGAPELAEQYYRISKIAENMDKAKQALEESQ